MIRILALLLLPFAAQAESLRVATFNTELSRDGPGLLLRDIQRGDPQVEAVVTVLTKTHPDIVALQGIDWDFDNASLTALANKLAEAGLIYPFQFTAQPNSGMATALDLDGDGNYDGPGDAQGWGRFTGQSGLAVLSRFPIDEQSVISFSELLWRDLPGAELPQKDGAPFPSLAAHEAQRLSSIAHWVIPISTPQGQLNLMTFHASPPVFDGPEDRNGLRNRDEIRLWSHLLDGKIAPKVTRPFVIAGDANQDPTKGEGLKTAITTLLAHPRLQDPGPRDPTGSMATVSWKGVGELRVDYVLPSSDWHVVDTAVYYPAIDGAARDVAKTASRHRLVWVDLISGERDQKRR